MEIEALLWGVFIASLMVTATVSMLGIVLRPSLAKKLIALTILSDTACLFLAATGFRVANNGVPGPPVAGYANNVDPLPQAMVITAIVIELGLVLVLTSIAIKLYSYERTLNLPKILAKEEVEAEEAIEE